MIYTRTRLSRMVLLFAVCVTLTHALFAQTQTPPARTVSPGPYAVTVESTVRSPHTRPITRPTSLRGDRQNDCRSFRGETARAPATAWRSRSF